MLALALTWVLTAAIVVVILFTPTYLQQVFHVPARYALQANTGATFTFAIGCLVFGWASDRFGTRATMAAGFAGLLVSSYLFYAWLPAAPAFLNLHLRARRLLRRLGRRRCRSSRCGCSRRRCVFRACRSPTTCRTRSSAA